MKSVRLRPHHIAIVNAYSGMDASARRANARMLEAVFNEGFAGNLFRFVAGLREETVVMIVPGTDDLCEQTECPYRARCNAGEYRAVQDEMLRKAPPGTSSGVLHTLAASDPETEDSKARETYGIQDGKTYTLGKLYPATRSTRFQQPGSCQNG